MPLELIDVRHQLSRLCARTGSADTLVKGNVKAAMATLVRTNLEVLRGYDTIKARPIVSLKGVVQLTDDRRHGSNPVLLVSEQRFDTG